MGAEADDQQEPLSDGGRLPPAGYFPRGGAGPPQPLPRGAPLALFLVSVAVIASVVAMAAWVFL